MPETTIPCENLPECERRMERARTSLTSALGYLHHLQGDENATQATLWIFDALDKLNPDDQYWDDQQEQ